MINWCLTPTLVVFQLYSGVKKCNDYLLFMTPIIYTALLTPVTIKWSF
jgi:hypothetical protein